MPEDVRYAFEIEAYAASLGISPAGITMHERDISGGRMGRLIQSRFSFPPGRMGSRQRRAAATRGGTVEERIVGAALGWQREYWSGIRTPSRRARHLDVAEPLGKVNVELDGQEHRDAFDLVYDKALEAAGWTVLRYWNEEALSELGRVRREARSAAGEPNRDPVAGDLDGALSWAASEEMEAILRPILAAFAAVFVPEVIGDGLVSFWLELSGRFVPAAHVIIPDGHLILTTLVDHVGEHNWSFLSSAVRDIPVYQALSGLDLWVRPSLAKTLGPLLAAFDDHLLRPAANLAAADEATRLRQLAERTPYFELTGVVQTSDEVVVEGVMPTSIWEVGPPLKHIRETFFLDGLTSARSLRVVLRGPEFSVRVSVTFGLGPKPSRRDPQLELLCDVTTTLEDHLRSVRDPHLRESTLWSGSVLSTWGGEHERWPE